MSCFLALMTAKQRPKKEELKTLQMEVHGNTRNGAPRLPLCRENVTSKSLLILVLYIKTRLTEEKL